MAIKKPGSRVSDRNKIRKLYAQGYSVEQIANQVSIVEEHVIYVLEEWDAAAEKQKDIAKKQEADAYAAAKAAQVPANAVISVDDAERARIREAARRELLEEIEAEKGTPLADTHAALDKVVEENPDTVIIEEEPEKKPTPRRKRKQAA